jgi:AbrB family looped-hinge helix DNA binding protein
MPILSSTKISKGFRVTIPMEVRKSLDLKDGETLIFFSIKEMQGRVCFRKMIS